MKGTCRNLSTKNGVCELPFCGRWPMLALPSGRLAGPGVVGGAAQGYESSLASVVNGGSALPHLLHTDNVRINHSYLKTSKCKLCLSNHSLSLGLVRGRQKREDVRGGSSYPLCVLTHPASPWPLH